MILTSYACVVVAVAAYLRRSPEDRSVRMRTRMRVLAAALGIGLASIGVLLLPRQTAFAGTALALMLVVGGLTYAWGVVRWSAPGAAWVRRTGWGFIAASLALPSTLTLLLPLACLLLPTLRDPQPHQLPLGLRS
jgi:predicted membrane channel-forming protein YqfA (hemolysin III family)